MVVAKIIASESPVNIVDVFGDIISSVRAEYDSANLEKPYYEHGHPIEIINTLKEKSNSGNDLKFKKFPLIILLEDFKAKGAENIFIFQAKLNFVIVTNTSKDYKASHRYTNSFDQVLTPLYKLFMKHTLKSVKLHKQKGAIQHNPINRLYWGRKGLYGNEGNIFDDYIDAIEIMDFDAKIYR